MSNPFHELRERLLRAGVAPRHVRRYLRELSDHLADLTAEEMSAGRSRAEAESAVLARLGSMDDLAQAMTERRQLRSWCARAPWAMFSVAPLLFLGGAYFVAGFILWSGWRIFLPGADIPFGVRVGGPIYGIENIFFQTGRMIYFGAPIVVGWGLALMAARQRLRAVWPAAGLLLVAWMGGTARVHAIRPAVHGAGGQVSMSFLTLGPSAEQSVIGFLLILSLTLLPYLIWRIQRGYSLSA